jgi:hypothetical protein
MIDRRTYQREVERLLSEIETGTHDLRLLKVAGVRGSAVDERKLELGQVRERLASLVEGSVAA